jgi:bla regulator protein blaR1
MTMPASWLRAALQSEWVHRLGWTLLHSLWQGAAVALGVALVLVALRRRGPQAR